LGRDIALTDIRHELAQCSRRLSMSDPCQVGYTDRLAGSKNLNPLRRCDIVLAVQETSPGADDRRPLAMVPSMRSRGTDV
jgi:hypothetical protein